MQGVFARCVVEHKVFILRNTVEKDLSVRKGLFLCPKMRHIGSLSTVVGGFNVEVIVIYDNYFFFVLELENE